VVRNVLAVVAGIIAAILLSLVASAIVVRVYSPIVAFVPVDRAAVIQDIASLPVGQFLLGALGHALATCAGGAVAALLGTGPAGRRALSVGVALTVVVALSLLRYPPPLWVAVLAIITPIPMSYLGAQLAGARASVAAS
jgi:hypothetical protein